MKETSTKKLRLSVEQPTDFTEFEIQSFVYTELKNLGFCVRGEVKTQIDKREYVRFDLAIFEHNRLSQIIEIKRNKIKHKDSWKSTRQGRQYARFGVPIKIIYGMEEAKIFVNSIKNLQH